MARERARYLVIGGFAVALHGLPRVTEDIDLAISPTLLNARRVLRAMEKAGYGTATMIRPEELVETEIVVCNDRLRVDLLTRPKGLAFPSAWRRRETRVVHGVRVHFASLEDLIAAKDAAGRPVDLADLVRLREALERRKVGRRDS
ncbi:MAG: nucleotidyltransferase [Planctomycetes bacterium]|nr:nucleotidyltransferase [Planctomycetota bacterium]